MDHNLAAELEQPVPLDALDDVDDLATYFHWRSKCAGASVDELKRQRELEAENAKLKRMYAESRTPGAALPV